MIISALYIYPIKSLGGITVDETLVEARGFEHDRRWVLVDKNNRFLSQREHAQMALISVSLEESGLKIQHQKLRIAPTLIPFKPQTTDFQSITVWDDTINCQRVSDEADAWFSGVLGQEARLFYQPEESIRIVDQKYATESDHTSLSDGFPVLIISEASMDFLNEKSSETIEIQRFRPNIVFKNSIPHEEDSFADIAINDVLFEGAKPCARCIMTTINPATAEKGKEPLKSLTAYRKWGNKILFGENLLIKKTGKIAIGDTLNVLSRKEAKL
jgi:uncharacterized protein